MSQVTVRIASELSGKSRETINKATKDGTLSFSLNSKRHKVIEIVELERVYPLVKSMDEINTPSVPIRTSNVASESDTREELAVTRQKLTNSEALRETLTAERERERRQLESEIENLRSSLEKSQDQHNKALLLITDQSQQPKQRGGGWEDTAHKLTEQIAQQQVGMENRLAELQAAARRQAIQEIKGKSWWRVLVLKLPE